MQRTAGNRAVASLLRYTERQARERGAEITAERGVKGKTDLQDYLEGSVQVRATEREEKRRADALLKLGGPHDFFDTMIARLLAGVSIVQEFKCDRLTEWRKLLGHATLWDATGYDKPATAKLAKIKKELTKLVSLLTGPDLKAQRKAVDATETAIDAFIDPFAGRDERNDLFVMMKRYTLGHERKKIGIAERILDKYSISLDSMELIKANKKTYGNKKTLEQYIQMQEPEVFSLEELKAIETVLERYAPVLGKNRPKAHGKQPLTVFGRAKFGIDHDDKGVPVRDPGTRGESFAKSKTVGMYDEGAVGSQFPTGMQQFRGTFAHELSHALIEDVKAKGGKTMIDQYAKATGVWTSHYVTPHQGATNTDTYNNMKAAGKEPPITEYGCTNAGEDLADAIKYLFEDTNKLKTDCPIRYRWILANLGPFFEKAWFSGLPAAP